ncbi:CapA family protein [Geosporobacter ferrireducens]|uniref:Capsule biosynthesis protein CapA n=1 Tax=Geosporobacter ferrireducens TaxID=1424294 RepID=A0A1D8GFX7_9FIRM|nr:CapA family protein [Geosporobacter ferrireducens]AOT69811.1 capsule biosynthesis protein CapA [Geosporobacter ferrireducens]
MKDYSLMMVGDLILDEPAPIEPLFDYCRQTLKESDFLIGHIEVPHTTRGTENSTDVPAPPANPEHLNAMVDPGFDVATLAGNHFHDNGIYGIQDTIAKLNELGIASTGAGMNIMQARTPAIIEKNGLTLGVLSYNTVGPRENWATSKKPGCAYVNVLTHYELEQATPGAPGTPYTFVQPASQELMEEDIKKLRSQCDILVVSFHKGIVHTPAALAMYERPLCRGAIDAGADIVIGQHAHILKGIEIYKGKPIYHNLGNFVTVTYALTPSSANDSPERIAWAQRREKLFGFKPDPETPHYPFNPESRNTFIAKVMIQEDGPIISGLIPCRIDKSGAPHVLNRDNGGQEIVDYVEQISKAEKLKIQLVWEDNWVRIIDKA